VKWFTTFERHSTTSHEVTSEFVKVFIALVINSVLIDIVLNASPAYFEEGDTRVSQFLQFLSLNGEATFVFGTYSDFSPEWYVSSRLAVPWAYDFAFL
jgi:hypothetical protein